jgi:hypothetical protein
MLIRNAMSGLRQIRLAQNSVRGRENIKPGKNIPMLMSGYPHAGTLTVVSPRPSEVQKSHTNPEADECYGANNRFAQCGDPEVNGTVAKVFAHPDCIE